MVGLSADAEDRPTCPRLDPQALRNMGPYIDTGPDSVDARLAESESLKLVTRRSFWECEADYNPLGQFGAAWSRPL